MNRLLKQTLLMAICSLLSLEDINGQHKHKQEKPQGTANAYMHQSSTQELIQRFESPERDAYQKPNEVLDFLGDLQGKKIMDLGAGSGYFSVKLAKRNAQVIAADPNEELLNYLKNRTEEQSIHNISLRKIPYDNPLLLPQEVDMVFTVNTYHHIENRKEYFKKVKQGIKQGGKLVIIDFYKIELPVGPPVKHKVSIDEVIDELCEAGFVKFDINTNLLPYQYIIQAN